jgi:16S rRNA G527 N7-methylase RsmG
LIEVRTKRAAFLRHVATTLKLSGLVVHKARFEEVAKGLGAVDWITLQGVALESELIDSIRQVGATTTMVVWITSSGVEAFLKPQKTLHIPYTNTQVFLFRAA